MEPKDVVQAFYDTLNTSGPEAAAAYLAEDYALEQPGAPVQTRDQWLATQRMWRAGFPDLQIIHTAHSVEGNLVHGTSQSTGTHTGDLDLGQLGMGVIAATGKSIGNTIPIDYVVDGDKIVSGVARPAEGSGIPGLLAQLGVEMP